MPVHCQICLEAPPASDQSPCSDDHIGNAETSPLLTQLCSPQCEARICLDCLSTHVRVSLEPSYAGALPRVRCPICLVPLHKRQWAKHFPGKGVEHPDDVEKQGKHELVEQYEARCRQACAVLPPCCHKQEYSHLPPYESVFKIDDFKEELQPFYESEHRFTTLTSLCQAFEARQQSARVIVDWLGSDPLEKASAVLNIILPRIRDDERRATLLLSFLHVNPNTWTRCCSAVFCFNCKREQHHDKCHEHDNVLRDMDYCFLECRNCHAMLLKVEGCGSVACLCGFAMEWDDERWYRDKRAKQLIPVDTFDIELFSLWDAWAIKLQRLQAEIAQAYVRIRAKRVTQALNENIRVLRKWIGRYIWRCRYSRLVVPQISWVVRKREITSWVVSHRVLLHQILGRFAWRRSFSRSIVPLMTEHEEAMRIRWKIAPWRVKLRRVLKEFLWRRRNDLICMELFE